MRITKLNFYVTRVQQITQTLENIDSMNNTNEKLAQKIQHKNYTLICAFKLIAPSDREKMARRLLSRYLPPLSELRKSLKERGKEYLRENSLHGFPYFVDSTRPKFERVIWFLCTLTSFLAAIAIMITIWNKFQQSPTQSKLDVAQIQISEFPNIYLCFNWDKLNFSVLEENDTGILQTMYEWDWQPLNLAQMKGEKYFNNDDLRPIFYNLAPDCDAMFSKCTYRGYPIQCGKILTKVLTSVGACCKFTSDIIEQSDIKWSLTFLPREYPFRMYISGKHDMDPLPRDLPLYEFYSALQVYIALQVTTTDEEVRTLSLPKRKCTFDDESRSYIECERQCLMRNLVSECGCLPWFLGNISDVQQCPVSKYSCLAEAYAHWNVLGCSCYIPCNDISYDCTSILDKTEEPIDECSIAMKAWPDIVYRRDIRFTWLDLLGSFGGIAGSFLGYSLLTSFELVYYFTLRMYCGAVSSNQKPTDKKPKVTKIELAPAKKTDDLEEKLKYCYFPYVE